MGHSSQFWGHPTNYVQGPVEYVYVDKTPRSLPIEGDDHIYAGWFYNRADLIDIELPSTLVEICTGAFSMCTNLKSVKIKGCSRLFSRVFIDCVALSHVELPHNIKSIEAFCFSGCRALEEITIPESVEEIGPYCFNDCTALRKVVFEGAPKNMEKAFISLHGIKEIIVKEDYLEAVKALLPKYLQKKCKTE